MDDILDEIKGTIKQIFERQLAEIKSTSEHLINARQMIEDQRNQKMESLVEAIDNVEAALNQVRQEHKRQMSEVRSQLGQLLDDRLTTSLRENRELETNLREITAKLFQVETKLAEEGDRRQLAEARAADAVTRQQILEVELVRAKRKTAEALRREQAAEGEAALALRREQAAEGEASATLRQYQAAQTEYASSVVDNRGRRVNPFNLRTRWELARLLRASRAAARQHDWSDAEAGYGAMTRICGTIPRIWVQYGHALKEQGKLADAERAYREAVTLDPMNADNYLQLGHALKLRGANDAAREAFVEAFRLKPSLNAARGELVAQGFSRLQLADIILKPIVASTNRRQRRRSILGPREILRRKFARAAAQRRDWATAARLYQRVVEKIPGASTVWIELGYALEQQRRLPEAESVYFEALKLNHNHPETILRLEQVLKQQGEIEVAFSNVSARKSCISTEFTCSSAGKNQGG